MKSCAEYSDRCWVEVGGRGANISVGQNLYNGNVARGWESKSVEEQMDAAETRKAAAAQPKLSEAELRIQRERESIQLSRGRILRELEAARHPRHRGQLSQALSFLDERLSNLQGEVESS